MSERSCFTCYVPGEPIETETASVESAQHLSSRDREFNDSAQKGLIAVYQEEGEDTARPSDTSRTCRRRRA